MQQLANPRRANGARPGLGHLSHPFSAFSAFSNTGSGPAWSDGTRHEQATTMPNWLGARRVGERSLDFLRHPARLPGLPLSTYNVERAIVGRFCQPGRLAASSRRDRVCQRPVPRLAPADLETARARKGSPPAARLQFSAPHRLSSLAGLHDDQCKLGFPFRHSFS